MGSDPRQDRSVEVGLVLRDGDLRAYRGRLAELTATSRARASTTSPSATMSASPAATAPTAWSRRPRCSLPSHAAGPDRRLPARPAPSGRRRAPARDDLRARSWALHLRRRGRRRRPARARAVRCRPADARARTTEALELLQRFLTGEEVDFAGPLLHRRGARSAPPRDRRSRPRRRRAGRRAACAPGVWATAGSAYGSRRAASRGQGLVQRAADAAGRAPPAWRTRCSSGPASSVSRERAVARVRPSWRQATAMPFERFERYTPCGASGDVAAPSPPTWRRAAGGSTSSRRPTPRAAFAYVAAK